jgi:hypothetical protein
VRYDAPLITAQTVLTLAAGASDTTLQVASLAGFAAGDAILLELPGNAGWKTVEAGAVNPVTKQIPVLTALRNGHIPGTPVSQGRESTPSSAARRRRHR